MAEFVGRSEPLARLVAAHRAVVDATAGTPAPAAALVLVTGEAGIGKTSLLRRFSDEVDRSGGVLTWGACWDRHQAPAWWPWTEAMRGLLDRLPELEVPPELGTLLSVGDPADPADAPADAGGRVRIFDAAATLLGRAATGRSVVVILDDLHWSDPSTLDLVRFLVRHPGRSRLLLVGAYRPADAGPEVAPALAELAMSAELVPLQGLTEVDVTALVHAVAGAEAATRWGGPVHRRSGGHPFFARELCRSLAAGDDPDTVPAAVRDVIRRRLDSVSEECASLVGLAAIAGSNDSADVLATAMQTSRSAVGALLAEATGAGVLIADDSGVHFAHDLYREAALDAVPDGVRVELHARLAAVLGDRRARGIPVHAGDLARHAVAGLPLVPAADAVARAREAAAGEEARFAFAEAARHLGRVRRRFADSGQDPDADALVGLAVSQADLLLKAGDGRAARELLESAWTRASAHGDGNLMGSVALGLDRCGARFAMPRERQVGALEAARTALGDARGPVAARVTAALARQLQHSVPADRPRAAPLAEEAVALARDLDDVGTLASCLLAQHDTLWTPGTAVRRVEIAREITALTRTTGDREALAQGLLLTANAQLESGSPEFRATLEGYRDVTRSLRQPRHDYLLRTREAALALLDGDIALGDRLSAEAAELGEEVGDSDTGNVRLSQLLEVVRVGGRPDELRDTAARAVEWWVGAPAHAHAVAAGFLARAGDLEGARRELDTVLSLDDWRTDRSYLWSVFVGELVTAAIATGDRDLCRRLLDDLRPLRGACAVNGALVCFMGAHAHRLGLLHAALGDRVLARELLTEALAVHERLGARAWAAQSASALARVDEGDVDLRQIGDLWEVGFRGRSATVRDTKGVRDLAVLIRNPGSDVPALELVAGTPVAAAATEPVLDRGALTAYRSRIAELDHELDDARAAADLARVERAADEREQLIAELRKGTRPDGSSRSLGGDAERARKAVSARIRDAIGRIEAALPELGRHLDRSVTTGTTCRYEPREG